MTTLPTGRGRANDDNRYLLVLLRTTVTTGHVKDPLPTGPGRANHDNRYLLVLLRTTITTVTYWSC